MNKLIDFNLFYVVKAEVQRNLWRVSIFDIKQALKLKKNLLLIDPYNGYVTTTYPLFSLEDYEEIEDKIVYLMYEEENEFLPSKLLQQLLLLVHHSWINELYEFFFSNTFLQFLKDLQELRAKQEVFPINSFILNAFCIDLYKVKGVIVSEECYPNHFNNGFALSTYEKQVPASLKAIEDTIRLNSNPYFGWTLQKDLLHLINQGVMLLPYKFTNVLTCVELFEKTIEILRSKEVEFLFLGTGLKKYVKAEDLHEKHPVEVLTKKETYNTNVFTEFAKKINVKL